jgi:hypothetical protein
VDHASVDTSGGSLTDIRNDITNMEFATPREVQNVTGLDKSAMERIGLLADGSITLNGVFNPDASKSHVVLSTVPSTSVNRTTSIGIGGKTLSMEMLYTDYSLNRAEDGSLTWSSPGVLADGAVPTWA